MQTRPFYSWFLFALLVGPAASQEEGANELGESALAILERRCATCHAPDSSEPKATRAWMDALDVQAAIEDQILEPGDVEGSYLWELIAEDEMPPKDAESGALTAEERETLRAWIAAGVPTPGATAPPGDGIDAGDGDGIQDDSDDVGTGAQDPEVAGESFDWHELGRLHPVTVHLPVGLLLGAVLAEILVGLRARGLRGAARFCAWAGLFAAGLSAWLGWELAERVTKDADLLRTHRWLGVATTGVALLLVVSLELRARERGSALLHFLLVSATAVVVGLTGHWGGMLSWGADYLDFLTVLWR